MKTATCPNCDQCAVCGATGIRIDPRKLADMLAWFDEALQSWEGNPMPSELRGKYVLHAVVSELPEGFKW